MPDLDATCSTCNDRGRGTYVLLGKCRNCGWSGEVELSKGHQFYSADCPYCECRTVNMMAPVPDPPPIPTRRTDA